MQAVTRVIIVSLIDRLKANRITEREKREREKEEGEEEKEI